MTMMMNSSDEVRIDTCCGDNTTTDGDGDGGCGGARRSVLEQHHNEQWEKLLGNGRTIVAAGLPRMETSRRLSSATILQTFQQRLRVSLDRKDDHHHHRCGAVVGGGGSTGSVSAATAAATGHVFSRYRQSRINARRIRKRVVFKHGDCNVVQGNVAKRRRKYMLDIFTTLVDAQWRWTLLVFSLNFLLSWLAFAIIWWFICFTHGDLNPENLNNSTWVPCITNIQGFTSCFLYSVETQHTIGYGGRTPTEQCPEAIFVMCMQSIAGVMIQAFMVGVVFAKLSRPKKRTQTLLFSRNAVIAQRDGVLCLMFRVGDMRKSHIIEAHVRAQLIKHKVTKEGESLPFYQTELKVGIDGEEDKIFFIWPTTIVHKIDNHSPLYQMSATDLLRERFEIVVILEGVIESTGMTTQARSSYLPLEILWGHRFQPLVSFKTQSGEYEVDYALFNNTIEVDTPLISAKQLDEMKEIGKEYRLNRMHLHPNANSPSSNTLSSLDSMSVDFDPAPVEIRIPDAHTLSTIPADEQTTTTASSLAARRISSNLKPPLNIQQPVAV